MINIENEHLVSLHDVPRLLPARDSGKRIHISAIYRWAQRGIRGTRLEVIKVGGTTYTSREALQRFASLPVAPVQPAPINSSGRKRQIDRALSELDEFLYKKRGPNSERIVSSQAVDAMARQIGDGTSKR